MGPSLIGAIGPFSQFTLAHQVSYFLEQPVAVCGDNHAHALANQARQDSCHLDLGGRMKMRFRFLYDEHIAWRDNAAQKQHNGRELGHHRRCPRQSDIFLAFFRSVNKFWIPAPLKVE